MNEMTRTIAEMKDRVKTETWQQRIQECQQSGKGVQVWCKENGIAASTYYRYLRKIRETLLQDPLKCNFSCSLLLLIFKNFAIASKIIVFCLIFSRFPPLLDRICSFFIILFRVIFDHSCFAVFTVGFHFGKIEGTVVSPLWGDLQQFRFLFLISVSFLYLKGLYT